MQWEEHRVFVVLIELGAPSCHILLVAWGQTADTTRLPLRCVGVVDGPDTAVWIGRRVLPCARLGTTCSQSFL